MRETGAAAFDNPGAAAPLGRRLSTRVRSPELGYVILANCNDWVREHHPIDLHGEVLSIYEASDSFGGTCQPLSGSDHGAVFLPIIIVADTAGAQLPKDGAVTFRRVARREVRGPR